jgi:hypothetical protein
VAITWRSGIEGISVESISVASLHGFWRDSEKRPPLITNFRPQALDSKPIRQHVDLTQTHCNPKPAAIAKEMLFARPTAGTESGAFRVEVQLAHRSWK